MSLVGAPRQGLDAPLFAGRGGRYAEERGGAAVELVGASGREERSRGQRALWGGRKQRKVNTDLVVGPPWGGGKEG